MRLSIGRAAATLAMVAAALVVPGTAAHAAGCTVTPAPGQASVPVYQSPTSIPPSAKLPARQKVKVVCADTKTKTTFVGCGVKSKLWVKIIAPGLKGYVRRGCVTRANG